MLINPGKAVKLRAGPVDAEASSRPILPAADADEVLLPRSCDVADDADDGDVIRSTSGSDVHCLSAIGCLATSMPAGRGLMLGSFSSIVLFDASSCCL